MFLRISLCMSLWISLLSERAGGWAGSHACFEGKMSLQNIEMLILF